MMNTRRWKFTDSYRFTASVSVVIETSDDLFTEELATEMNSFWTGSDDRLSEANGDVRRAALLMVATQLIGLVIEHDGNAYVVQREFDESEGFPSGVFKVREVVGLDPLEYHEVEIEELT